MISLGFFFRSIALLVLISPPHQVRTAAHTASEYDSYLHRRCWTVAASKGLFCPVCIVLALVAVRFASWTMMAELCFSVDDLIVLFSSNSSNSSSVIASFPLPSASALCVKLCLTDVSTYTYLGSRRIPGTNKRAQSSLRTYVAHTLSLIHI